MKDPAFRPVIALTLGDPNGIGPEVVLKTLSESRLFTFCEPVLVGPISLWKATSKALAFQFSFRSVKPFEPLPERKSGELLVVDLPLPDGFEPKPGHLDALAGQLSMQAVEMAVDLCKSDWAHAMVTAPISKEAIQRGGYHVPGHTEFIAERCGKMVPTMMMVAGSLRVALLTAHIPLREVPQRVTRPAIVKRLLRIQDALQRDFGIERPRIAVLGLNPHAGDGGVLGSEELDIIVPALSEACDKGVLAFGAFPADGFFATAQYRAYDAVLALYHDQGLIPFKTIAFEEGVNYTAGLPIVRTSPDHGTAFDLAGQNKANPASLRSALLVAIDVARYRSLRRERA